MNMAPHNIQAEEAVLGAMLVFEPAVGWAIEEVGLRAEDFCFDRHKAVYRAMVELHGAGKGFDSLMVTEALASRGKLDEVGGGNFVAGLAEKVDAPGNALHHAELVRKASESNKLVIWGQEVTKAAGSGDLDRARNLAVDLPFREVGPSERTRLYTLKDMASLPEPRFLIRDFLRATGNNVLFGPSGSGKSFLALDLSLCIGAGLPFYGQEVEPGTVVYGAGEGVSGYYGRSQAWCSSRGVEDVPGFLLWPEAVNYFTGDTSAFEAAICRLDTAPSMIVADTMARHMVGGDENSVKDVGLFIDNLERVARNVGAATLIVHHTGKNGELERGSTALRGAADTMLKLAPDGAGLRLTCEKQKDGPEFDPWKFHLEEKAGSAVIRLGTDLGRFSDQEHTILESVSDSFGTDWVSATKIIEVSGIPKSSFYRSLKSLVDRGSVEERFVGKQRKEFRVPPDLEAVPDLPKPSQGPTKTVPSHTSLLEVGQGPVGAIGDAA